MRQTLPGVFVGLILFLHATASSDGAPYHVGVLYPDLPGHYQKVYAAILAGMADYPMTRVTPLSLSSQTTSAEVDSWAREQQVRAVVSLGMRGYQVSKELARDLPVVLGAVVVSPNGITGLSLAAAPEVFLDQLQALAPAVDRVFVVYSEKDSGWLVRQAEKDAASRGMHLVSARAANAREAVQHYTRMLADTREGKDAVWLPLDSVIAEDTVLPLLLEAAWKQQLVIFSNNPSHAKMGALFSLYPDNQAMGRHLAAMAVERLRPDSQPKVEATRMLKVAFNRRTAAHLGLTPSAQSQRRFDLIYPAE